MGLSLLPLSWQSLRPMPAQSPITMDIMADIPTIVDTGVDTVDTMDTPTDTGSVKPKLHPLPLLLPLLMLMPMPLLTTTDTTDIPTDTEDIIVDITDTLTDTGSVKHKKHLPLPLKNMPSKNDLLMPMLMPALNPNTTDTDTDTVTDTGVRFLHHILSKHMPPLARPYKTTPFFPSCHRFFKLMKIWKQN